MACILPRHSPTPATSSAYPLVDVLVLSGLYTLRLLAGSAATHTPISHWLAGFSFFLFLSLGIVKRFAELENLRARALEPRNGRGYFLTDLEQLRSFGTASAYASAVILAIYISSSDVERLYHHAVRLWLAVPLLHPLAEPRVAACLAGRTR